MQLEIEQWKRDGENKVSHAAEKPHTTKVWVWCLALSDVNKTLSKLQT